MGDWGPVVIAVVLFVLLTPGLLFHGVSILVHSIIYFALVAVFLIAIGVHITTG
ncbi:unnamed protein product [Spirodela intermedia]|uniref:Uncharacterized protein n=1 Tax=Spirodela intermedia TaxID=51605 RepID=A0A7I8JCH5_SPIIN|nr:unnamed protein product [Spirodela intermedia]CAA6667866.1 unnamed protein product [Spirodela intermedia]